MGHSCKSADLSYVPFAHAFFCTTMSTTIHNFGTIHYNDHSKSMTVNTASANITDIVRAFMAEGDPKTQAEDIEPIENTSSNTPDSIIFTKKAHKEGKITDIIQTLQKSLIGRNDKTRALVQELQSWQKDEYIDPYFNAQVMYDELNKIVHLPFGYDAFKRLYNNTRS